MPALKVFITGTESFVGKALIRKLDALGAEVHGMDAGPSSDARFFQGDIRDQDLTDRIPEGLDALIHLAALSRDIDCKGQAKRCFDINVMGSLNLMDLSLTRNCGQFVFASSEWVYDNPDREEGCDEETPINILNLKSEYALSKIVTEANLKQWHNQGNRAVTILRFGIIYGPRDSNWSAVESLFHQVQSGKDLSVGSLDTARSFIHVNDIAEGIARAIGQKGFQILNLQGPALASLRDIIGVSAQITGKKPLVVESDPTIKSIRNVKGTRAEKVLRWRPQISLSQGLLTLERDKKAS